jgi:hypothetical protein
LSASNGSGDNRAYWGDERIADMKLKAVHWILLAIGGTVFLLFALLGAILVYKFFANPRTIP